MGVFNHAYQSGFTKYMVTKVTQVRFDLGNKFLIPGNWDFSGKRPQSWEFFRTAVFEKHFYLRETSSVIKFAEINIFLARKLLPNMKKRL